MLEYNSVFYKVTQSVFNVTEFTKSMLYRKAGKFGESSAIGQTKTIQISTYN